MTARSGLAQVLDAALGAVTATYRHKSDLVPGAVVLVALNTAADEINGRGRSSTHALFFAALDALRCELDGPITAWAEGPAARTQWAWSDALKSAANVERLAAAS